MSRRRLSQQPAAKSRRGRSLTQPEPEYDDNNHIDDYFFKQNTNLDELADDLVRFIILNSGHNRFFKRAEFQKLLNIKSSVHFQTVVTDATKKLHKVYGYNLLVCDQTARGGSKGFVVSNAMPFINYNPNPEDQSYTNQQKIVLLLILSHIFMNNGPVSEMCLYSFLDALQLSLRHRSPVFGNLKEYIHTTLLKQKYLASSMDAITKKVTYVWGIRAEKEISKHEILEFVCKVYGDRNAKSFSNQYKAAVEQGFENDKILENDDEDDDEE